VTDFPSAKLLACPKVICIPHLGASTPEAEDNCAVMAVQQLMDFLEAGTIKNSVNFPRCALDQRSPYRLLAASRNVPNTAGQITAILAEQKVNVTDLINHPRDDYAYTIIDTEQKISDPILERLKTVEGILRVRTIEQGV
jgi:D-3-phosphoglycerate dehydrogenase